MVKAVFSPESFVDRCRSMHYLVLLTTYQFQVVQVGCNALMASDGIWYELLYSGFWLILYQSSLVQPCCAAGVESCQLGGFSQAEEGTIFSM